MIDIEKERNMILERSGKATKNKILKTEKNENERGESGESSEYVSSEDEEIEQHDRDRIMHYEYEDKENDKLSCEKEIQITFTTELLGNEFHIENNIYTVPVSFKRIDLSRMIKKLLHIENTHIAFEFLINKKILRTSIGEFLEEYNILSENVLEIEFTKPLLKKESKKVSDITEWISELIIMNKILYCSSFEGNLLSYDLQNFNKKGKTQISQFPIYSFNCCQKKNMGIDGNIQECIFGFSNGTLQAVLQEQSKSEIILKSKVFLSNHDNIINSIAFSKNKSILISGGADKRVNIYDNRNVVKELKQLEEESKENNNNKVEYKKTKNNTRNKKRKDMNRDQSEEKKEAKIDPKKSIYIEDLISISSVEFFVNTQFLCTGLGNTLYIFDAFNGSVASSYSHNKSIVCSTIIKDDLFATADEHSYINLFDKRCLNEQAVISLNPNHYFFHDKIVSSLKGYKSGVYFLTSSHDGYINIYDTRLSKCPVYAIENEDKCKVLAATWFYEDKHSKAIVSADEKVRLALFVSFLKLAQNKSEVRTEFFKNQLHF